MTHNKVNAAIARLQKIEQKAVAVQSKLDLIRQKWEAMHDRIRKSKEWENYCHEADLNPSYDFGDLLS